MIIPFIYHLHVPSDLLFTYSVSTSYTYSSPSLFIRLRLKRPPRSHATAALTRSQAAFICMHVHMRYVSRSHDIWIHAVPYCSSVSFEFEHALHARVHLLDRTSIPSVHNSLLTIISVCNKWSLSSDTVTRPQRTQVGVCEVLGTLRACPWPP